MPLADVVSHAGLAVYAEVALVLFFLAFILISVRLWVRPDRHHLERMSRMPLDDGASGVPRAGANP
jgi:hypothetical protein